MTTDTTVLRYWWNWRFLISAIFILSSMVLAAVLIWKYEGCKKSRRGRRENQRETVGSLFEGEAWRTSFKLIHPTWLLAYRVVAFVLLLSLIVTNFVLDGAGILYFYTQWTFCLVTIYFGLGSSLSIYGCYKYRNRVGEDAADRVRHEERGSTYVAPTLGKNADTYNSSKSFTDKECPSHKGAGLIVYIFQVIYQMCGGAVVLTDVVFWLILYPFLTSKDYKLDFMMASMHSFNLVFLLGETTLNSLMMASMHSFNLVFLLGETTLNSLRFPLFRISYFVLWTGVFVIFQWIIHACKNMWYLGVGVMHIPCYGIFALIIWMKQLWFSRSLPESFQGER
ncbi:uncharacterized protein LOC112196253 isoform X2 [Rosa chinensis]|uniref:uncharacterized protein LOC112196253 isoform X2 n=1 Tax=Rosa chinensis TaxID=74649 RepID=UPI001AD8C048|nr:uncharacterized protein LOC112196253 isoform X2 [Rosa chinensis]